MKEVKSKKNVLIISYYFPPFNSVGAVRLGKFAKYLPEFGWEPFVLTVDTIRILSRTLPVEMNETNIRRTTYNTHYSWNDFFTNKFGVAKTLSSNPKRQNTKSNINLNRIPLYFFQLAKPIYSLPLISRLVFEPMGWYRDAVHSGLEIIRDNNIDMIFSSFGPAVTHMIAAQLHKQTKIPWVAEFRDPWSFNTLLYSNIQPFHFFEKRWEKRVIKDCDLLITVSKTLVSQLESLHSKRTVLITNGFDEDDYRTKVTASPIFSMTYAGTIYQGKTDPSPLFKAVANMRLKGILSADNIEIRFFGENVVQFIPSLAQKFGILDLLKISGVIPFKDALIKQRESTILLSLNWNSYKERGGLNAKVFEYFGVGKPILAMGLKGGELDDLLQTSGCGVMSNEVSEIEDTLLKWFEEFRINGKISSFYHPNRDVIHSYTRREQTRILAQTFDGVLS